jgi:EAL and modified HD-GYP domain-containing signal transduction protein
MSVFVARQPILNSSLKTSAYELLFRSGNNNCFDADDADQATLSVINNTFLGIDMEAVTGGKKAFINCTRYLLLSPYLELLPPDKVVIEILEDVKPDQKIYDACARLKSKGYTLALDDFEYSADYDALIDLVDIIKVDFMISNPAERKEYAERFLKRNIAMLAEKVECQEEVDQALEWGYTLFQGYFFSKPVIIEQARPPEYKIAKLQLLSEVNRADFDFARAEYILKHDPTLAIKLLKYVNSAGMGVRNEIQSIRQAMTLLGRNNIRKWISVLILSSLGDEKPAELLRQSIVRARFCELLGQGQATEVQESLFLTGMLSLLDAMMNQPKEELFSDLPVPEVVKETLMGKTSPLSSPLLTSQAFEVGEWDMLSAYAEKFSVPEDKLPELYQEAISWAEGLVGV